MNRHVLDDLLADGTIDKHRAECRTDREMSARLGVTVEALQKWRKRRGLDANYQVRHIEESFEQSKFANREDKPLDDFADEDPTQPGIQPIHESVPDGHRVRGVSTMLNGDGAIVAQWIKTSAENDERQDWLAAIENMPALRAAEPIEPTAANDEDLLAVYPVGDPHVGLLAWHRDAGENFDMDIAERNLVYAFQHLVGLAPAASEALLIFIGDNTHVDSQFNTTTAGTRQDADGRTVKMADTIIAIIRQAVAVALQKHQRVRLVIERGNHDELISAMVALAMRLHYESEPRVSVDTSPEMYHWFRFGSNLIGTHHGDKAKSPALLGVMACDRAEDWGQTKHRRFYCGHYHHLMTKEEPGLVVEYLPTLAGSDAWHRSMGYRSGRAMYMDVLDRNHGHVDRHIIGISQIRARTACAL